MKLNQFLYKKSIIYFTVFLLMALIAFWPGYYGRLSHGMPGFIHLHGIAMSIWCLILVSQAWLVRTKNYRWHRIVGKLSYAWVPVLVLSGFHTAHQTLKGMNAPEAYYYSNIALMFNAMIVFAILYGLAMYNRKRPEVHGRYMLCTIFPLLTPMTDRLTYYHFESILQFFPTMDGIPIVWLVGFGMANMVLAVLTIWDWFSHRRLNVFLTAWGWVLLYHMSVLGFHNFTFWQRFGDWIMGLPLS